MFVRVVICCLVLATGPSLAGEAEAQVRGPVSAELSLGLRVAHGGAYHHRGGPALDLLVARRLHDIPGGRFVGGVALGLQAPPLVRDLSCLVLPQGDCAPDFPALMAVAALVGVQSGSAHTAAARLMAGPTYHQVFAGGGAVGLQGRADASVPTWGRTAAIASLQHSLLPSFRGDTVSITSFGLGLRIQ
ncbi:hypothetical protein BH23GEM8_BH23GEM8_09180 [soil metagenome]